MSDFFWSDLKESTCRKFSPPASATELWTVKVMLTLDFGPGMLIVPQTTSGEAAALAFAAATAAAVAAAVGLAAAVFASCPLAPRVDATAATATLAPISKAAAKMRILFLKALSFVPPGEMIQARSRPDWTTRRPYTTHTAVASPVLLAYAHGPVR